MRPMTDNNNKMKKILVTGAAGFIGYHLVKRLCAQGHDVYGLDNLNDYYDPTLKYARLHDLSSLKNFSFEQINLALDGTVDNYFSRIKPDVVVNLAAQAGVRYSIENPHAYMNSNMTGFFNVLEACRKYETGHLIFASSSSVYGANTLVPFAEAHNVDHPVSFYAATKKSNELMAHSYAHIYGLPCTGLRLFTVYGPWGRPDMAYYSFADKIMRGEPIAVFNYGDMSRDFTYIDDVVESVARLTEKPAQPNLDWSGDAPDPATSRAPYRLYNIGNNNPEKLMDFIDILQQALGRKANIEMMPMQQGDVQATYAKTDLLAADAGFAPSTSLEDGIGEFVQWYLRYHEGQLTEE